MSKLSLRLTAVVFGAWLLFQCAGPSSARAEEGLSVTVSPAAAAAAAGNHEAVPVYFEKQVNDWIRALSQQHGFESWRDAKWKSFPLGPGMHGWVVLVYDSNQKEAGYLIVGSTPDGKLVLTEYGTGDKPLFSLTTLYRTMMRLELILPHSDEQSFIRDGGAAVERIYLNALHAVWQVSLDSETYYIDAKTGEHLPLTKRLVDGVNARLQPDGTRDIHEVKESYMLPAFDPYERLNFIVNDPMPIGTFTDLAEALKKNSRITFAAQLFDHTILAPMAVIGYQLWNDGEPFVIADEEGLRYIPYRQLSEQGHYYR